LSELRDISKVETTSGEVWFSEILDESRSSDPMLADVLA